MPFPPPPAFPANPASPFRQYQRISEADRAPSQSDDMSKGFAATSEGQVGPTKFSNGGTLYTYATLAYSAAPAGGVTHQAIPLIQAGVIVGARTIVQGIGYVTAPTITVTGDGSGAVAACCLKLSSLWQSKSKSYTPYRTTAGKAAWLDATAPQYPADIVAGAVVIVGTRRLKGSYTTGPLFQIKLADTTLVDIPQLPDGRMNEGVLLASTRGTTYSIVKYYNQDASGNDLVQSTVANGFIFANTNRLHADRASDLTVVGTGQNFNTTGVALQYMTVPAAITANGNNLSLFTVTKFAGSQINTPLIELTNTVTATQPFQWGVATSGLLMEAVCGGSAKITPMKPWCNAMVAALTSGATGGVRQFLGNDNYNTGTFASATLAGGFLHAWTTNGSTVTSAADNEHCAWIVYNTEISDANRLLITASLNQMFDIHPQFTSAVFGYGDSIDFGLHCTNLQTPMRALMDILRLPARYYNISHAGDSGTVDWPLVAQNVFTQLNPGSENVLLFSNFVTNDLISLGKTPDQIYAAVVAVMPMLHSYGIKVGIETCLPRGLFTAPNIVDQLAYNVLANANTAGADVVIDVAADPVIGLQANTAVAAVFIDGTHLASALNRLKAHLLASGLRPLWNS